SAAKSTVGGEPGRGSAGCGGRGRREGSRKSDMRSSTCVIRRLRRGGGRADYPTSAGIKQWHQAETITADDAIAAKAMPALLVHASRRRDLLNERRTPNSPGWPAARQCPRACEPGRRRLDLDLQSQS